LKRFVSVLLMEEALRYWLVQNGYLQYLAQHNGPSCWTLKRSRLTTGYVMQENESLVLEELAGPCFLAVKLDEESRRTVC
jgi:hypothetical protein